MFYKKEGFPEEDEIVLCTVKKILHNSIFASIDEYENLEGMIHISEIAPGRIRNIRDYVRENKLIVCKVIRVNPERKQVDISLRRVSLSIRTIKLKEYKQEIKAEKLLELAAKSIKLSLKQMYEKAGNALRKNYDSLYEGFQEILKNEEELKSLKLDKKTSNALLKIIKENIKLPEISLKSLIVLQDYCPEGIEHIKESFKKTDKLIKEKNYKVRFIYNSAPNYNLEIKAPDFKTGEKILKEVSDNVVKELKSIGGIGKWQKVS